MRRRLLKALYLALMIVFCNILFTIPNLVTTLPRDMNPLAPLIPMLSICTCSKRLLIISVLAVIIVRLHLFMGLWAVHSVGMRNSMVFQFKYLLLSVSLSSRLQLERSMRRKGSPFLSLPHGV